MLKLSKLYSNKEDIFPTINFHDGLNVVYATASKIVDDKKSSHSLGKTKLSEILDYMLIKKVDNDFFLKQSDNFSDFIFFLEIKTSENLYITIERQVKGKITLYSSKIQVNVQKNDEFSVIGKGLGVDAAKEAFEKIVKLSVVFNALGTFRKGLRYCIRNQEEYSDVFKSRNVPEKDRQWKPYLCGLLGINPDLVEGKYNTKETVNRLKSAIEELELIESPNQTASAIEAEIVRLEKYIFDMDEDLSKFSFEKIDENITRELVDDVGKNIADINQEIYSIQQRIHDIDEALKSDFNFNVDDVVEIFKEIEIHLPDLLVKTYEDLVKLNEKMTHGRKDHLENAKQKLIKNLSALSEKHTELSKEQQKLSGILIEKEAFKKYQSMQDKIRKEASRLSTLKERLEKLDGAANLRVRLADTRREEEQLSQKLILASRQNKNGVIKNINLLFGEFVKDILGINAYFYLNINKDGNPEIEIGISDNTAVYKGYSFKKVMAACFDLALLTHYSDSPYYRFSYHDGLLESLEDKVKLRLIDTWRVTANKNKLQLIVTVLDADIPENSLGSKVYFKDGEIIRELHDKGDNGRLFKMKRF